jgi:hypothetical protein
VTVKPAGKKRKLSEVAVTPPKKTRCRRRVSLKLKSSVKRAASAQKQLIKSAKLSRQRKASLGVSTNGGVRVSRSVSLSALNKMAPGKALNGMHKKSTLNDLLSKSVNSRVKK